MNSNAKFRAASRKLTLIAVIALTLAGSLVFAPRKKLPVLAAVKPNIIVILAGDLGYADISAYKINRFQTPNIDRIGLEGVRLTDGYATAPVCGPSRAGLMTGRYQERFGFEYNLGSVQASSGQGLGIAGGEVTIAQLLKNTGYHTGLIGKWHLGSEDEFYPTNRGFDEFVGFLPGETSYMDPKQPGVHASYGLLGDSAFTSQAPPEVADADQERRLGRIAATFARRSANQVIEGPDRRVVQNEQEYLTDYFGDRAVEYLQRDSKSAQALLSLPRIQRCACAAHGDGQVLRSFPADSGPPDARLGRNGCCLG